MLEIDELSVSFATPDGVVRAVNSLSLEVAAGETLGIVGESGSGKSQTMLAVMGLLADNGSVSGSVRYRDQELLGLAPKALNRIRGEKIAMIFQDPMTSLNPYLSVATQMTEVLVLHKGMSQAAARQRSLEMLDAVHIPDAASRLNRYPHEFSGGMRQRVMIAMALLCGPDLLIADEPSTALDVTVQAQILALLQELQDEFGMAIVLITHDLGVVAGSCDRLLVMYGGQVMERGSLEDVFYRPQHPYTRGLLRSVPRLDETQAERLATIPGNPPNMLTLPAGCPFQARCEERLDACAHTRPPLVEIAAGHAKACHLETAQ